MPYAMFIIGCIAAGLSSVEHADGREYISLALFSVGCFILSGSLLIVNAIEELADSFEDESEEETEPKAGSEKCCDVLCGCKHCGGAGFRRRSE